MIFWCQVLAPEGEQAMLSLNPKSDQIYCDPSHAHRSHCLGFCTACLLAGADHAYDRSVNRSDHGIFYCRGLCAYTKRKEVCQETCHFAVISWIPFSFFEYGHLPIYKLNGNYTFEFSPGVIYTLFLALLAIWVWDKGTMMEAQKKAIIAFLCILSIWGDWPIFDILYAMCFFCYLEG